MFVLRLLAIVYIVNCNNFVSVMETSLYWQYKRSQIKLYHYPLPHRKLPSHFYWSNHQCAVLFYLYWRPIGHVRLPWVWVRHMYDDVRWPWVPYGWEHVLDWQKFTSKMYLSCTVNDVHYVAWVHCENISGLLLIRYSDNQIKSVNQQQR